MIYIKLYKNSELLTKAIITGHCGIKGKSIPCAALSYLVQSICTYLIFKNCNICGDNKDIFYIDLKLLKEFSEDLFNFFIFSLKLIARDYPNDINLEYLEENNGT